MRAEDLVIGKRYRIRQWDDMAKEFGVYKDENIRTRFAFTKRMSPLCGKVATLIEAGSYGVYLENWIDCNGLKVNCFFYC